MIQFRKETESERSSIPANELPSEFEETLAENKIIKLKEEVEQHKNILQSINDEVEQLINIVLSNNNK